MARRKNFPLRIDPKLYEVLEKWAADEFRSVNGQIEFLLRDAAVRHGRYGGRVSDRSSSGPTSDENQ